MKSILPIALLLFVLSVFGHAATRGDVKVIEASENIRYLSQKIVKDYLFLYAYPDQKEVKSRLARELKKLGSDLREIAITTKDSDTKDILEFLAYSKDQIEDIISENPDKENAALMLDYSETLLEGADSIALSHKYDFSTEEHMLMTTKKIEYLLERVTKYYIAVNAGFDNSTNKEQLQMSMTEMEENLLTLSAYGYSKEMRAVQLKLDRAWKANRAFLMRSGVLFIPKLMLISIAEQEEIVAQLALYHSKNQ